AFLRYHSAALGIYTLPLHDALPISKRVGFFDLVKDDVHQKRRSVVGAGAAALAATRILKKLFVYGCQRLNAQHTEIDIDEAELKDRKSTRLNSSHVKISYAVFCLKK